LLVKGPFCFVFGKVSDSSPKYAISLCYLHAVGNENTVNLETTLGEVEYTMMFADAKQAQAFKKAVASQASKAETEQVRKVRTASVDWGRDWYRCLFLSECISCTNPLRSLEHL
jgi:hypothetical protein